VCCSTERKAREGAEILAGPLGLPIMELDELGENDRSATGYLPKDEFEATADVAIVAHGGVGTLLLCHFRGDVIGRQHDQPPNNGGNYFAFDAVTRRLHHGWYAIDS
jgi:broad specificity phosphatase PhoE